MCPGSSGKWAASAPSKGWGRTHIANSSRPGTFKRPGAGVAIRAPDTQEPTGNIGLGSQGDIGEEAQPHSPDTLVLARQRKKNMLQSNQGSGSPYCSHRKVCDLPCVSGGQGRWTRSVTNLTRYISPWQFWPKWEMGRLRTFKRLGAHAHREVKSPRDLQKARGGRSDPRQLPKPCHQWQVGGITHRHPHLPAMESLSPRLRSLLNDQCRSEAKTLAEVMVVSRPARQQHAKLILAPSLRKSWARRTLASRACGDLQTWSSTHTSQRVPAWKE